MIQLPRRSVTRFFIPLIDVLTLLFCIFLLMPLVKATGEGEDTETSPAERNQKEQELQRLRREKQTWRERDRLEQEKNDLQAQLERLRKDRLETLQRRLTIRALEIGEDGRLFYYDPVRAGDRRVEITRENVQEFIERQKKQAGGDELYFLFLYPRPAAGFPVYPLRRQREEYDRWFEGVAHGYDIPVRAR